MEPPHPRSARRPGLELLATLVWIFGATASYFAGATFGVAPGMAALLATFWVTLLLAWLAIGRGALPRLLIALLLQAPLLLGLSLYALHLPLGHHPFPCFFFEGTNLEQLEAFAVVTLLSAPIGFLLRLEVGSLRRLRSFARLAAPFAVVAAAALALLGGLRLSRLPPPERYLDSLPLHATIPSPRGQPCTPIENKRDPAHDSGRGDDACATPEFDAGPIAFHYHAESTAGGELDYYELRYRTKDGDDASAYLGSSPARLSDLPVRREASLNLFFVLRGQRFAVVSPDSWQWDVSLHELRHRLAPPLGWWWITVAGLVFGLACLGASAALGDVAAGGEARARWIATRRGALALAALAVLACTSAPLFAALLSGFLT